MIDRRMTSQAAGASSGTASRIFMVLSLGAACAAAQA
jgi:hypothetical protein